MKFTTIVLVLAALVSVSLACVYDSECGANARCINAQCLMIAECNRHLDCLKNGLYYECDNTHHCVQSKHKICRSNDDCKKNILHTKCKNDRCT